MNIETYTTIDNVECVMWTDDNGTIHSMTKEAYDKQQAEQSTPIVIDETTTK
jgi:hypothetical protein